MVTPIKTKVNVGTMMLSMMVWLAIYLYSFEWRVDSWIRKCRGPGLVSRYQGRQRGRGSAGGRTTQRGDMS
jgi:hypothetical protein